jgi:transcriptional regulator
LILKILSLGGRHGYGIARHLEKTTEGVLQIEEGSLYPALYRLQRRGWIRSEWGLSEHGRRAKFYRLTELGREQLEREVIEWAKFSVAVSQVLLEDRSP